MAAKILAIVILTIVSCPRCDSGRILAIIPTPSYSHQIVFMPLWLKLNSRGHHITLLTTDPIRNSNLTNFRQVDWSFAYKLWHEKHNITNMIKNFNNNLLKCLYQYTEMMTDIISQELEHPEVQRILNDDDEHFDLLIVEVLNPAMLAFSKRFKCPFIALSPMDVTNFIHESLGNPVSPALFPDFMTPFVSKMSFWERLVNSFYYLGNTLYFRYYFYPKNDQIARKFFGPDIPNLEDLQRNASLVFLNTNPVLHNLRPLVSNVIAIGGSAHIQAQSPLPPDIQLFLDRAKTGAVYFSLGTNVKSKDLSEETKRNLVEAFSELPYKVVWKLEDTNLLASPNVLIKQWLPQQQILSHPNLKLFITQGGLQSLEETIYYAVPILGIPIYVDQYSNVRRAVDKGVGVALNHERLTKKVVKNAITEVITNPKYKAAALEISMVLRDQPVSGLDQAVWWSEYVLEYNGARFLKPPQIPLYQYLLVDVTVFLVLTLLAITYLWYLFLRRLFSRRKVE